MLRIPMSHQPIRNDQRHAFTLVELLTVMAVLGIIAGFLLAAIAGVTQTAKESRTRSIISAIDSVLQEQYESYQYRPLPVEVPDAFQPVSAGTSVGTGPTAPELIGYEVLANEAARARLMMIRDLQRMEMPDRYTDITDSAAPVQAAANPVVLNSSGDVVGLREAADSRSTFAVSWYAGTVNLPSRLTAYRSRLTSTRTVENQGAECLFLIMSNSFVGANPAIDSIPSQNIGDIDQDGMPEILDGWGKPIEFIRWPVGHADLQGSTNLAVAEVFDQFQVDFSYVLDSSDNPLPAAQAVSVHGPTAVNLKPWALRPLIVSAGSDGEFGIATNPHSSSGTELTSFSYLSNAIWPQDAAVSYTHLTLPTTPYV